MREFVVDSSVVIKWFRARNEQHVDQARALLAPYIDGEFDIAAPPQLYLEMLNSFGHKWSANLSSLEHLLSGLQRLGLIEANVHLEDLPRWVAAGLSAYDAAFVAAAEARSAPLITADQQILTVAPTVARHVQEWDSA